MEKTYVQVMKAARPTFWYANAIGYVYEVTSRSTTDWSLCNLHGYYIQKQDCRIVNVNKLPKEQWFTMVGDVVPEPPELEENWHENLVEPARWEIEMMDLAANELELSL